MLYEFINSVEGISLWVSSQRSPKLIFMLDTYEILVDGYQRNIMHPSSGFKIFILIFPHLFSDNQRKIHKMQNCQTSTLLMDSQMIDC
jgi:hypothetical protein